MSVFRARDIDPYLNNTDSTIDDAPARAGHDAGPIRDRIRRVRHAVVAIAIAFGLSVVGAAIHQEGAQRSDDRQRLVAEVNDAAEEATWRFGQLFEGADTLLWGIAQAVTFGGDSDIPDEADLRRFLGRFHARVPHIANLTIIGADGRDLAYSARLDLGLGDHSGQPYFEQALTGARRLHVSGILTDPTTKHPYMLLLRRIDLADGSFVGFVAAAIETAHFKTIARQIGAENAFGTALFDRDGKILATTGAAADLSPELSKALADERPAPAFKEAYGLREVTADGRSWIAHVRKIEGPGITVAAFFDPNRTESGLRLHARLATLAALVCAGIALAVWWTLRSLREQEDLAAELMSNRQEMADIIEASSDWFWEQDHNLKFTKVGEHRDSPVQVRPSSRMIGQDRMSFIDPSYDPEGLARHLADLEARRPFRDFRYRRMLPDGGERLVVTSGKPVFDGQGEFRGYRGSARDVTQEEVQRRRLAQLANHNQLLVKAIECATNGLMITDPRRPNNPIVFVNRAFTKITGYASDEAQGRNPDFLIHPDCAHAAREQLRNAVAARETAMVVLLNRRKDGTAFWSEVNIAPAYDDRGELVAFVGIQTDVTPRFEAERRRQEMEDQVRQMQKMEAVGTLAGGIAHDLNNALLPIIMLSELMQDDLPAASPLRDNVASVLAAAQHSRDLVAKLLAFSRREESERASFNLAECIDSAAALARVAAPPAIVFHQDFGDDRMCVLGNRVQLTQVILNLMTNAIYALGQSGNIRLRLRPAEAADLPEHLKGAMVDAFVKISVEDDGPGMAESVRQRIFEPFFTTKPPGDGTGLGLAVVHNIVHSHGGAITVASTPGVGTEFHIFLPLEDERTEKDSTI